MSEKFSDRLAEAMFRRKVSGSDLSRMLGVSTGYVSELRTGKKARPSLEMAAKIAAALGVEVAWLAGGERSLPAQESAIREISTLSESAGEYAARESPAAAAGIVRVLVAEAADLIREARAGQAGALEAAAAMLAQAQRHLDAQPGGRP